MTSVKNLPAIFNKIIEGTAPDKFTVAHLKSIGFKSSNDQGIIPLLKDLGFLSSDGSPTQRYHAYRDRSNSKIILGEALNEAYGDLFHINEKPTEADRVAIEGKFKSVHNTTDRVSKEQAKTFYALLEFADIENKHKVRVTPKKVEEKSDPPIDKVTKQEEKPVQYGFGGLRYNIEIHLPATKDPEVYNAIFKSLKEHLLEN
jgi:hypothetical protein